MNVYKQIKRDLWSIVVCVLMLSLVQDWMTPHDNCDGPDRRCQLNIRTDALSGCQYLESRSGALTPRMGADGRQICSVGAAEQ